MTYTKGVVLMLMPIGTYVRRGQKILHHLWSDPRVHRGLRLGLWALGGFLLSAASLAHGPLPLVLSLLCAGVGAQQAVMLCLGGILGYPIFWGSAGMPGIIWTGAGLLICLTLGDHRSTRDMPLLLPMLAGLSVAFTGLMLRFWGAEDSNLLLYFLRIGVAIGASTVFATTAQRRAPVSDWLACGFLMLALAQVPIFPGISLGMVAAGALAAWAPFPAVALSGLALDLSRTMSAPMTALLCLAFFIRLIPYLPKWVICAAPAATYLLAAPLCGAQDLTAALPLALGGALSTFLPPQAPISHRRGETGVAQVRLEMAAGVLAQCQHLLLEQREYPIDEAALIIKAAQRACLTCACRKTCREQEQAMQMPVSLLHRPLISPSDIPVSCRKQGRLLQELRRSQEQLRAIRADRDRQREYRSALTQQYRFLSDYLQTLADTLPRRGEARKQHFDADIGVCSAGLDTANGDRCLWFAGPGCQYYVLLCDGMGTGLGAQEESRVAADMLRRLLTAGYPAEQALTTLNDLLTLRGKAGAVTVDLAQIDLQNGKACLYKWGAAASYLLTPAGAEKIGTAGPPPGLSVTDTCQTVDKLSLRRGQTLVMLSDGVDGEAVARHADLLTGGTAGELSAQILQYGRGSGQDDATAAVIRLRQWPSST